MARHNNSGRKGGGKQRILNVRLADSAAGSDGLRVDRMISAVKDSESQMRVLIGASYDFSPPTTADALGTIGFDEIFSTDDFGSILVQWNLFRVTAIKFDIYDVNPSYPVNNTWGIWHDNYESSVPAYSRANVVDLPDSRVISGGAGQTTLYWVAHGTKEMGFQATSSQGSTAQRFGGLKYFVQQQTAAQAKYIVQVHAVVDFRGRR